MGEPEEFIDRGGVLAWVLGLVGSGARAVTVVGAPGSGKTTLLERVARAAETWGWTQVTVTGRAAEQSLPLLTLADLLTALRRGPGGEAFDDLLGTLLGAGPTPAALSLRHAVRDLLHDHAAGTPLLVLVDDAQWVDPTSLSVLAFAANRVQGGSVSFVFAARDGMVPTVLRAYPALPLQPLDRADARELLTRAGLRLTVADQETVLDRAAGNPLALLELARAAPVDGRLPESVEAAFAAELPGLPSATRDVLLLAAAGGDELAALARLLPPDVLLDRLESAEAVGLVRIEGGRVRFRHPLVGAAVLARASSAQRVRAHRRLATAYADPDRQTWHEAEATVGPDDAVADRLVAMAERAFRRAAYVEAHAAMLRASQLTPDPVLRDRRALDAIERGIPAGRMTQLAEMAAEVRDRTDDPHTHARADHLVAYVLAQTVHQDTARRALNDALELSLRTAPGYGWSSLTTLGVITYQTGEGYDELADWLARYRREAGEAEPGMRGIVANADAWIATVIRPTARPRALLDLVRGPAVWEDSDEPAVIRATRHILLGAAAWQLQEDRVARDRLAAAVEIMERTQATSERPQTLITLAQVRFELGEYDEADRLGAILVDLAEGDGLLYTERMGHEMRARVAAVRGDAGPARRLAEETLPTAVGRALEATIHHTLAYACFADADLTGWFEHLRRLFDETGRPLHGYVSFRGLGDLVSAAVRLGRTDDVRAVVEIARGLVPDPPGTRQRLMLDRVDALLATDDGAEAMFCRVVDDPEARQWPFEQASVTWEYGGWLRRRRQPTEARRRLTEALGIFTALGARPWAEAVRRELRATGQVVVPAQRGPTWDRLTPQEREVVVLAARGLSNREIGSRLNLSPRTVGAHLYRAFPKLGVTARFQLRDVVAEVSDAMQSSD